MSPLQYFHQLDLLNLLPALVEKIIVPSAVLAEIEVGRENGLDDLLARKTAQRLKIKVIGTLGILLEAKKNNLISEIAPILDKLENLRFRLSDETRKAVLKLADEYL